MNTVFLLISLIAFTAATVDVPHCSHHHNKLWLKYSYINGTSDDTTQASLCHDDVSLFIKWFSRDSQIISPYQNCNDPLYNDDAVEVFIATEQSYPLQYFQFEISPSSALFFANISNPTGDCSALASNFFPCDAANYKAYRTANGWNAQLSVRLDIIGRGKAERKYKINLLRIDVSSNAPERYLTWRPTYADPACFHVPKYFEEINLI